MATPAPQRGSMAAVRGGVAQVASRREQLYWDHQGDDEVLEANADPDADGDADLFGSGPLPR
eukprot:4796412-Pyramimonas_sp.AAC.1